MDMMQQVAFIKLAYKRVKEHDSGYPYTIENVIGVFKSFFAAYESNSGSEHPWVSLRQLEQIIKVMPWTEIYGEYITPELYPEIIEEYFQTELNADYRIYHFFSGNIRLMRLITLGYSEYYERTVVE